MLITFFYLFYTNVVVFIYIINYLNIATTRFQLTAINVYVCLNSASKYVYLINFILTQPQSEACMRECTEKNS